MDGGPLLWREHHGEFRLSVKESRSSVIHAHSFPHTPRIGPSQVFLATTTVIAIPNVHPQFIHMG